MSEMHDLIVSSTEKILKDYCVKELLDQADNGNWSQELWEVLVEAGITLIGIPEEINGVGGDYIDAFHILRLMGTYAAPVPLAETLIVNWLITEYGLEPTVDPVTIAENEPLNVSKTEKSYDVSGVLTNVPYARFATKVLAKAVIDDEEVTVLVDLTSAEIIEKRSLSGEPLDTVIFDNTNVYLDVIDVAHSQYDDETMELGALARATMISGAMERILDLSIQYTSEREQFGRPLNRLQAIQQHLSILAGETAATLAVTNKAIDAYQNGVQKEYIAYAKVQANDATTKFVGIAHQIHGAIGATYEHILHHLTRRLWAWREQNGTEQYWTKVLAEQALQSNDTLWTEVTKQPLLETI